MMIKSHFPKSGRRLYHMSSDTPEGQRVLDMLEPVNNVKCQAV
jgi:hypothetical protein